VNIRLSISVLGLAAFLAACNTSPQPSSSQPSSPQTELITDSSNLQAQAVNKLVQAKGPKAWDNIAQEATAVVNTKYTASFRIKGAGEVTLRIFEGSWVKQIASLPCVASVAWKTCTLPVQIGAIPRFTYNISNSGPASTPTFIDDAQLLDPSGKNILSNSNFEAPTLDTWYADSSFTLVSENVVTTPPGPNPNNPTVWKPLKTGAGGFIIGLSYHPAGRVRFATTDTYGLYRWSNNAWVQSFTSQSMPATDVRGENGGGVQAVASAPTDENRAYMAARGRVFRSDNQGATWARTAIPVQKFNANDDWRQVNQKLMVDPANANIVMFGTPENGLWRTINGGANWTQLTLPKGLPVKADGTGPGISAILFDPSSTVAGVTQTIYAGSNKNGIYKSINAGTTWTRISSVAGSGLQFNGASLSAGVLYVATNQGAWRFKGGVYERMNVNAAYFDSVISDPRKPNQVLAINADNGLYRSLDGGQNWTLTTRAIAPAVMNDVPWIPNSDAGQGYFSSAQLIFDPQNVNRLWLAQGAGVWFTDTNATNTITWQIQSRGIEQLVSNDVVAPPGGPVITASWDFGIFAHDNLDVYATTKLPTNRFNSAWDLDYATIDPKFLVAVVSDHRFVGCYYWCQIDGKSLQSGYSTNGGRTWTVFPKFPAPAYGDLEGIKPLAANWGFGNIAVNSGDTQNIVWQPSRNRAAYFTKNRGQTWTQVVLPGTPVDEPGSHYEFYLNRKILTADRVTPGVFYLYHSAKGLYKTVNGGTTWALVSSGEITEYSVFNAKLGAVPGKAGHLFFTPGPTDGVENPFRRSIDGGANWTTIPNVTRVLSYGFGKPLVAGGYPTIYVGGKVSGQYGIWRSTDNAATWKRISDYPTGIMDGIQTIEGDPTVFGKVYVGFGGTGFVYGQPTP
jgi:hypothetical protein